MKMMNRHCETVPVVEGDIQLIGMVTLRESFPWFKNKW